VAEGAWRCSQCGTVNEPVANACRTCGRWPSLFELEGSTIEAEEPAAAEQFPAAETVDVERFEPEVFEPEALPDPDPAVKDHPRELPPEFEEAGDVEEHGAGQRSRRQVLARLIVPIGVVVYILVSALVDR